MSNEHTPGDWIVKRGNIQGIRLCEYHDGKWIPVEESREDQLLGVFVDSGDHIFDSPIYRAICVLPSENYPNAHLLAASKDLLKACQHVLAIYEGPQPMRTDTLKMLRAAIAKATAPN